ncbi:MAG: HEAT repeat domain-containing protein [Methanomassiliicoccus sp.]|nr:HEAT repeat domain-containing protein [Methanomassiliicoccus sp.]
MTPDDMLDLMERLLVEETRENALEELEKICREGCTDPRAVTYLIPVLHVPDDLSRRRASWLMGKLAQNKTSTFWPLEELNNLLHDQDAEVRENAAWAIGELTGMRVGGLGSIEHLNRLLMDPIPSVRGMAAWTLGRLAERLRLGFQSSIGPLRSLLDDRYDSVRRSAQYALDHLTTIGVEE